MTMCPRSFASVLAGAVAALCACGAPPDTAPGVSWNLAQFRARQVSDVRYDLTFTIPPDLDDSIQGSARVTLSVTRGGDPLVFDFVEPESRVHEVLVDGAASEYQTRNDHLIIPLARRAAGERTVEIAFVVGETSLNRNAEFLYTLFVPDRARFAFPVFDQPNIKARYRLTLHLPPKWTAVANAPAIERRTTAEAVTVQFAETQPISSYLFSFAAGEFQVDSAMRGGRLLHMYHRETDTAMVARNREAIFELHHTALNWLESYTAIPYPFAKFDFVLIPSFQYGGMEHPGAILYRASSLLLDEAVTQNQLLARASVIAHETAHMWFGDLVTMNWFDDVWTKEVFANFMAAKIVNPSFPDVDHDLRFLLTHYPAAYAVDRTEGANPIRQRLRNLADAGSLYGAIIYQKAPIAMRHLEARIGEDTFRDGLRDYLTRFQFANATWPDLIEILDALTEDDLNRWSRAWVEEPGRPRITTTVSLRPDGSIGSLRINQEDPTGRGRIWPQRLRVLLHYPDTSRLIPVNLDARRVTVDAAAGLPLPDFLLANGDGVAYGEFLPDSASLAYLTEHLPDVADPLIRGVAWIMLWDAVLGGTLSPDRFVALAVGSLTRETVELNTQRILAYLTTAFWRYLNSAQREAIGPGLETHLWAQLGRVEATSMKLAFFRAYYSIVTTPDGLERLARVWRKREKIAGLVLGKRDYTTLALELAVREVPDWEEILEQQRDRIGNPDRRQRFVFVMPAVAADPAVRDAFFESLRDPRNREHEPWVLEAVSYLHHPLRAEESERYILASLELVEEIQRTGDIFFPMRWLNATLNGHNSRTAAGIVRGFLETRPDYPPRLRGKILQAADGLYRGAEIVGGF